MKNHILKKLKMFTFVHWLLQCGPFRIMEITLYIVLNNTIERISNAGNNKETNRQRRIHKLNIEKQNHKKTGNIGINENG